MLKHHLVIALLALSVGVTACSNDKPKATVAPAKATSSTTTTTTTTTSTTAATSTPVAVSSTTTVTKATSSAASSVKGSTDPYEGVPEKQKY